VGHSLSPLVHNTAFRKLGINAVYVPFRVPRDHFAGFLRDFDRVPVAGYSVTIPHKEAAAAVTALKDATVDQTHAANTLLRVGASEAVQWSAFNTDYTAAL